MGKPTTKTRAKRSATKAPAGGRAKADKHREKIKAAILEIDKAIADLEKAKKRLKKQLR